MKFSFIRSRVGGALLASWLSLAAPSAVAATAVSIAEQMSRVEMALDERDTKGAREWLQPLLARNDLASARRAEALWLSARLERMDGEPEAAMEVIGAAVELAREAGESGLLVQLLRDRVVLGLFVNQTETLRDDLREMVTLGSKAGDHQVVFDAGALALRLVDPDKAVGLVATFIVREGAEGNGVNVSSGTLVLADDVLALGDGKAALKVYDRLIELNEQGSAAFIGRAGAHILLGHAAEARADLASAREQVKREASSLDRDLAVEAMAVLVPQLDAMAPSAETPADDWQAQFRVAIDARKWEDARIIAESAIMRDRDALAPRVALAEVYLLQGEYDGAVNVFSTLSGIVRDSRLPSAGGNLAKALKGGEVYDVEGFAEDWILLRPAEKALLLRTVQAARERGPLPATATRLVAVVEPRTSGKTSP